MDSKTKRQLILEYLLAQTRNGTRYLKTRKIAQDLGMSTKEVGVNMGIIMNHATLLRIQKWSTANSCTWRIQRLDS